MRYYIEITIGRHTERIDGDHDYNPKLSGVSPGDELMSIVKSVAPAEVLMARGHAAEIRDANERWEVIRHDADWHMAQHVDLRLLVSEYDGSHAAIRGDILERGKMVGDFYATAYGEGVTSRA